MTDFNRVAIHGRLAKTCDSTRTDTGMKVVKFLLVSNKTRKLQDGTFADESSFFPLAVFGSYAELVEDRLVKGQGITVEGRIHQNRWEKDGQKHSELGIRVDHIYFDPLIRKNTAENSGNGPAVQENNMAALAEAAAENPVVEEFSMPVDFDFPPADDMETMAIF